MDKKREDTRINDRIVPESFRKLYERTQSGKAGPRQAIKMQCAECVGYDRNEVTNCSDIYCPLYHYRPFSGIKRQSARKRRIKTL